jgi:hypothetical protein
MKNKTYIFKSRKINKKLSNFTNYVSLNYTIDKEKKTLCSNKDMRLNPFTMDGYTIFFKDYTIEYPTNKTYNGFKLFNDYKAIFKYDQVKKIWVHDLTMFLMLTKPVEKIKVEITLTKDGLVF